MPYHERMDAVLAALENSAETGLIPSGATVLLAVSGGADSLALLHGAAEMVAEERDGSSPWRTSTTGGEPGRRIATSPSSPGRRGGSSSRSASSSRTPAAQARRLRLYPRGGRAPRALAPRSRRWPRRPARGLIATAHQGDDVLESHLIAVRRRGGVSRLGGPRQRRGDGVVRPLLGVSRAEILDFLAARSLPYRRNATNGDLRLARPRAARPRGDGRGRSTGDGRNGRPRLGTGLGLEGKVAAAILPSIRQSGTASRRTPRRSGGRRGAAPPRHRSPERRH